MVIRKMVEPQEFAPMTEDGWWESVLADEHRAHAPVQRAAIKPAPETFASPRPMASAPVPPPVVDWEKARSLYQQDQILEINVSAYNRGGLLVEAMGMQGFVPYSHLVEMTEHPEANREDILSRYVGRMLSVKIIECVAEEGRLVFSERAARAEVGCRNRLFSSLNSGQILEGEVTNVTDFGAFIDLGGVEGLIHISELSWGRVEHPTHVVRIGERVRVMVLDVLPERCRVALSLKRLCENPWLTVSQRYAVNDVIPATVKSVVSFGIFARLEEGLEGLVHLSQLPLQPAQSVREAFQPGQRVHVRILHIDAAHQRLGLSMLLEN